MVSYISSPTSWLFNLLTLSLFTLTEPTHERAISNKEYFDDLRVNNPDQYDDKEFIEPKGTERLEPSEKEEYEALCREGKPYVSGWVWFH